MGQGVGINGGHIALELRVLAAIAVHRELGIEDLSVIAPVALFGLAKGGEDELRRGH